LALFLALAITAALFFRRGAGVVLISIPLAILGALFDFGPDVARRRSVGQNCSTVLALVRCLQNADHIHVEDQIAIQNGIAIRTASANVSRSFCTTRSGEGYLVTLPVDPA
jgi:hypothetical protein